MEPNRSPVRDVNDAIWGMVPVKARLPKKRADFPENRVHTEQYTDAVAAFRQELLDNMFAEIGNVVDTSGKKFDGVYVAMREWLEEYDAEVHAPVAGVMIDAINATAVHGPPPPPAHGPPPPRSYK